MGRKASTRRLLCAAALIAVAQFTLALPAAHAQAFPSKPVRIVVNFPPGGAADQLGRALGAN